ncbi:carotenoid oxygenase [Dendryphion nanum]|uniref:Carotenoid oxygenase n=1 Tax=Dendryphion nanum TaxID=256645 RepID=A0A9P9IN98_9PLEO|nr:carotenoid oxygenase [Dendryphion nanum]
MLAGVLFQRLSSNPEHVVPHFVNQYILTDVSISAFETKSLQTPILPSITTLVNPLASLAVIILRIFRSVLLVLLSHISTSRQSITRISVANTSILYHDGRALATCESGPPIRIQLPGLETVGWFNGNRVDGESISNGNNVQEEAFGGTGLISWMKEWTTGHPKVDTRTGEMILFHCNFIAPYVHYSVLPPTKLQPIGTKGTKLINAPVPGCSGGKMMHDFGVSLQHTVILDLPLSLTPFNMLKNQPIVSYNPELPSRFGVFPRRRPDLIKWFETTGCCIFHTANTWDEYDQLGNPAAVSMLTCRLTSASLVFSAGNLQPPPNPIRRKPKARGRRSLFVRYDGDDIIDSSILDLEKQPSTEQTPLLSQPSPFTPTSAGKPPAPPISDDEEQCRLYYYRFLLGTTLGNPIISHQFALSVMPFEFPALNPAYEMSSAQYIYGCSTQNESFGAALGKATKIDVLVKVDVKTLLARAEVNPPENIIGCVDNRTISQIIRESENQDPAPENEVGDPITVFTMPNGWYAQEPRFVARTAAESEDDGYLLFYAFDESQLDKDGECPAEAMSELWILDAKKMRDVVARVRLPQRVPYGLHGCWFSETAIQQQRGVESVRRMPVMAIDGGEEDSARSGWLMKRVIKALG